MQIIRVNKYFVVAIIVFAIFVAGVCVMNNPLNLIVLLANGVLALFIWKKIRQPQLLISIYLILSCLMIAYLNKVNYQGTSYFLETSFEKFIPNFLILIAIIGLPFYAIYKYYVKKVGLAIDEEKHNYSAKNHPYLICKEHYTRTETVVNDYDFIRLKCRSGEDCAREKKLTYAKRIIGIVGKPIKKNYSKGNYYVAMWNSEKKQLINGDYDIIEIYNNPEIGDYDAVMSKVVALFYNEMERYIPIYQVTLKIIGKPVFSTSTQRLIDNSFSKIEYF